MLFAGITLSPNQVRRATELAAQQGLTNVSFSVMDALNMTHEDDKYDLVWACESGEHMPDKARYVQEMTRVLKPGDIPHTMHTHPPANGSDASDEKPQRIWICTRW